MRLNRATIALPRHSRIGGDFGRHPNLSSFKDPTPASAPFEASLKPQPSVESPMRSAERRGAQFNRLYLECADALQMKSSSFAGTEQPQSGTQGSHAVGYQREGARGDSPA